MLCQTDYIILRKIPFQESSLVVSGISPDYGRLDFLLKGARSSGGKKFPYAGLFRELQVEFRADPVREGLLYMKSHEPKTSFDAVAGYPENYLRLCDWIPFLLKHTRPMLELRETYAALKLALTRLSSPGGSEFQLAAARLVFLRESGYVPEAAANETGQSEVLEKILAYALDPVMPEPDFSPEYRVRLIRWVGDLCRFAESY